jgi:hypothetical protein
MAIDLRALQTPFVVVGGLAANLYMPERPTYDVDILVRGSDSQRIAAELQQLGCVHLRPLAFGGSSWRLPDGSILDVLESEEGWADEAVNSANMSPTGLPIVALPYLVVMKLDASRLQDFGDLGRMLGGADDSTREQVRDVIRRYRPNEIEDVESIIALGALEFQEG